MEEKIELKDALGMIATHLGKIQVPVELTEQVAIPICLAMKDLNECITALAQQNAGRDENNSCAEDGNHVE